MVEQVDGTRLEAVAGQRQGRRAARAHQRGRQAGQRGQDGTAAARGQGAGARQRGPKPMAVGDTHRCPIIARARRRRRPSALYPRRRPCYVHGPMADKKGFGSTVLGWFVVREGEGGGDKKEESADDLIAKYANDTPPPPTPPEVKLIGRSAQGAGRQRRFPRGLSRRRHRRRRAGAHRQGDAAVEDAARRDAQGRQEADRRGLAQGVRLSRRADHRSGGAGDPGARGLHPVGPARHAGAARRIAEAHRRARGGDRARQEGDGGPGRVAVRADAGVQSARS